MPLTHPKPHPVVERARAADVPVIGDIELFMREIETATRPPRIVAVTGTNGKSTTTALTAHLLKSAGLAVEMGGNIGNPVLGLEPPKQGLVYVLEISSYQIDLAPSLAPTVAVLLNITPDHIDRHGSMDGYVAVKRRIFAKLGKAGTAVIGVDDPYTAGMCTGLSSNGVGRVVPVSVGKALSHGVSVIDGVLYDGLSTPAAEIVDLKQARALQGTHNWQNAASAYAVCRALNCDPQTLVKGIMSFPGLAHRMEEVGSLGRVRFINDFKGHECGRCRQGARLFREHLLDCGRPAERRRYRLARAVLSAHRAGLSHRRGGAGIRRNPRGARGEPDRRQSRERCRGGRPRRQRRRRGRRAPLARLRLLRPIP